ncbi:MAG: hypothetical protein D6B28_09045 [Gammaproteobacteria bacterium]|nr:MAG: hypothetical protein D6B28_09045 [Gammaproteobacteria bacterium]
MVRIRLLSLIVISVFILYGCSTTASKKTSAEIEYEKTRQLAYQGNLGAQFKLGVLYTDGNGVTRNIYEAAKWFHKAADQGLATAQNNLGFMYQNGTGVIQDTHQAIKWYRKAAEQGLAQAQYNLGTMYYSGIGIEKNVYHAAKWFQRAAKQGVTKAQYNLGVIYDVSREDKQTAITLPITFLIDTLPIPFSPSRILNKSTRNFNADLINKKVKQKALDYAKNAENFLISRKLQVKEHGKKPSLHVTVLVSANSRYFNNNSSSLPIVYTNPYTPMVITASAGKRPNKYKMHLTARWKGHTLSNLYFENLETLQHQLKYILLTMNHLDKSI